MDDKNQGKMSLGARLAHSFGAFGMLRFMDCYLDT